MRGKRKIVVDLINSNNINNQRLVEYLTEKYKERRAHNNDNL